jgi:hypothetical protein
MIVLVCGGREYKNRVRLTQVLDELHKKTPITLLRHGACPRGADMLAVLWAWGRGVKLDPYPADWDQGLKAGRLRNSEMLNAHPRVELCVAFPGNEGTKDMVEKCKAASVVVLQIED